MAIFSHPAGAQNSAHSSAAPRFATSGADIQPLRGPLLAQNAALTDNETVDSGTDGSSTLVAPVEIEPAVPAPQTPFEFTEPVVPPAAPTGEGAAFGRGAALEPFYASTYGTADVTEFSAVGRRFRLHPRLSLGASYDSNIFIDSEDQTGDFILTVAPGLGFTYGSGQGRLQMTGDYTAGFNLFSDTRSADSIDHHFGFTLRWQLAKLRLGVRLGFEALQGADIDVGERVRRNVYYGGITSEYQYSDKTSFDLNADQSYSDYDTLLDSSESRVEGFANYLITPKVKLGVGGTLGVAEADGGPSQTYEQARVRAIYSATSRLSMNGSVGVEWRQFDGAIDDQVTPVFNLGAVWEPFDGTTISIEGRRRIYTSAALTGQNYTSTGGVLSVSQRFMTDFTLSLSVGYEQANYDATLDGIAAGREDEYFFIRPGVQWRVTEWCRLGLFYTYSENSSSGETGRSFRRDQIGIQTSLAF